MQEDSSGKGEHPRVSCLLEHPMVFRRQGPLVPSALSELRLAMTATSAGMKMSGDAAGGDFFASVNACHVPCACSQSRHFE